MSKRTKNILSYCVSGIIVLFFAIPFLAQAVVIEIPSPLKDSIKNIPDLIRIIINDIVLPIGGVIAVLMIIYAGYLFVTARGNEKKITDAKQALLYACIGAAILLGAWVISEAIEKTIGQLKVP